MRIHFVCNGNTFRSRLAEAYFNFLNINHTAYSSGLKAKDNESGIITWYAQRLLQKNNLTDFASPS